MRATTALALPPMFSAGFAFERPGSDFVFYGDYTWYGWSDLSTIAIDFADGSPPVVRSPSYRDSYTLGFGLDHRWTDRFTFRAGIKHDRSPTRDGFRDTTFADDDRLWLAVGGTLRPSERFRIDFAVVHVLVDDTEVDLTRSFFDGTPLASTTRTHGRVESTVDTLAIAFGWSF